MALKHYCIPDLSHTCKNNDDDNWTDYSIQFNEIYDKNVDIKPTQCWVTIKQGDKELGVRIEIRELEEAIKILRS